MTLRYHHRRLSPRVYGPRRYAVHMMYGGNDGNGWMFDNSSGSFVDYVNYTKSVWINPSLNLLHRETPSFLPNFKNPCWYEQLHHSDVYKDNKYLSVSRSARLKSLQLMNVWSQRLSANRNAQRLRCLPYFQVIGQPKCGSTDLFWRIVRHKDVYSPPIKELHWWSRNRQGKNINFTDIIPFPQYIDMFDMAALHIEKSPDPGSDDSDVNYYHKIAGEASVSTFWENDDWFHYPENVFHDEPLYTNANYVKNLLPNSKLILILRNPIDRLFSDYLYFTLRNKSSNAFHKRMEKGVAVYRNCTENHSMRYCVYNRTVALLSATRLRVGLYVVYLRDWLKLFPRDQLLVLRLEDYSRDTAGSMKKIFSFLNLQQLSDKEFSNVLKTPIANKRKKKDKRVGKMREETKTILKEFYDPYNRELASLLGDNRFLWNTEPTQDEDEATDEDEADGETNKYPARGGQQSAHDEEQPARGEEQPYSADQYRSIDDQQPSSDETNDLDDEAEQTIGSSTDKIFTKMEDDAEEKEDNLTYNQVKSAIKNSTDYYYAGYK